MKINLCYIKQVLLFVAKLRALRFCDEVGDDLERSSEFKDDVNVGVTQAEAAVRWHRPSGSLIVFTEIT